MNQPVPDCHFCHQEYYPGVEKECTSKTCGFSQAKTMKPAEEWVSAIYSESWSQTGSEQWTQLWPRHVEAIQTDAIEAANPPLTNQQELELAHSIADNERIRADQLHDQLVKMREKWLEARRYLRAANKGAERNAQALGLAVARAGRVAANDREQVRRKEAEHQTIVWNWLLLSDEDLRLKLGELSAQEIRSIRTALKAMLGTRLLSL